MILKILGVLLIIFGLIDLIGSYTGLDVWTDWLGIDLPDLIWTFTAYIEMALGYALIKLGSSKGQAETLESAPSEGEAVQDQVTSDSDG